MKKIQIKTPEELVRTRSGKPNSEVASWVEEISEVVPIPKQKNEPWNWAFWSGRIRKIFRAGDRQTFHKILKETKGYKVEFRGAILSKKIKDNGY